MISFDRKLKGFARIDGSGRVVPNTLIFRKSKPKYGKWIEVPIDRCCLPGTTTTTTTEGQQPIPPETTTSTTTIGVCATYRAHGSIIARVVLLYTDCEDEVHAVNIDGNDPYDFCAVSYEISSPGSVELLEESCTITTTSTTTLAPCDNLVCDTVMTVGNSLTMYGYAAGEGGYGTLDPNCSDITFLAYTTADDRIWLYTTECYQDEITLQVNDEEYTLPYNGYEVNQYTYMLESITSSPFPAEGETCIIRVCAIPCTTTSTTTEEEEITTTTTTTCLCINLVELGWGATPEDACTDFVTDPSNWWLDNADFELAAMIYGDEGCLSPAVDIWISDGTGVRQAINSVLGEYLLCSEYTTTTTTTEEPG